MIQLLPHGPLLWISYIFYIVTIWVLFGVVYRIKFHPLAKYPGPFLGKLSGLYMFYHAYKGDQHIENLKLHEKYGEFVRVGPNMVSINSNTALKDIYGYKSNVKKAAFYNVFPPTPTAVSTHSAIDKRLHARKRRILAHGFSDRSISELEPHIRSCTASFNRHMYPLPAHKTDMSTAPWSDAFDMALWSNNLTFDVIAKLIYSKSYAMMENPGIRWIQSAVHDGAQHRYTVAFWQWLYWYGLDKYLLSGLASQREKFRAFTYAQVEERVKHPKAEGMKDFMGLLTKAEDPETGERFTRVELTTEASLLVSAGSDTSSTALAATFFYLTRDAASLAKATAEVRAAFNKIEDIKRGPALSGCTFTRACIDEAMRLAPPVPGGLPREVLSGGMTISSHFFPAGTDVAVPAYAIHRNASYYPDPQTFNPSRWIAGATVTEESVELAQSAFCPFSIGPRGCIGKGLAYVEMMITMAMVLWEFDIRALEGDRTGEDERGGYAYEDCFVSKKVGPMVQFRPRVVG